MKYTFAQKLSRLNPKGMATESSEGNITAFRARVQHLNKANRVAEEDADSVISQYKKFLEEVSSSEQVLSFLIAVTWLINYIMVC